MVDGLVCVDSYGINVYSLDASAGHEQWRFTMGGGVYSSPAIVVGVLYIGANDGRLHAIGGASTD